MPWVDAACPNLECPAREETDTEIEREEWQAFWVPDGRLEPGYWRAGTIDCPVCGQEGAPADDVERYE